MRTRAFTPLLLAALLAAPAWAGEPSSPTDVLREAEALTKAGQTDQAIAVLQKAVATDPNLTDGWVQLGNTQLSVGRTSDAVTAYRAALNLNPNLPNVRYNLAYALRQIGQHKDAVAAYQAYLVGAPNDADALFGLAESLKGDGQWAAAADAFERYANAENRPTQAQWAQKARTEAIELRKKAGSGPTVGAVGAAVAAPAPAPAGLTAPPPVSGGAGATPSPSAAAPPAPSAQPTGPADSTAVAVPNNADAQAMDRAMSMGDRPQSFQDGVNRLRTRDFEGALAQLKVAAEKAPDDSVVLSALGSAHLGTGNPGQALAAYRRALALEPPAAMIATIQFGIAEAQRLAGNDEAAAVALRQVIADQSTPGTLMTLAKARLAALAP